MRFPQRETPAPQMALALRQDASLHTSACRLAPWTGSVQ
jgi:hypothetical protein